jgi:CubicO group peptidase (beta-lactamase class C family)
VTAHAEAQPRTDAQPGPAPQSGTAPLPRSTPREQGVDAAGVQAFLDALEAAPHIEPHSLMLVRHGHVVAEGWWHPYTPDGLQLLYSISKSFTATALGLAVAEGLVGLDDTVLSHFPELDADVTDPRSRRMQVRHVAAMASGHLEEALDRAEAADPDDLVRGFLLTPPEREPGAVFAYNQPCTYTVGAIVARRSGQSLTEYLRPRLLDPLGIGPVAWQRDGSGRDLGYSGLHATTDAIARLGLLHLQRGAWDGRQVLPAEWVDLATSRQVDNADPHTSPDWAQGYGFQFWQSRHGYRGDGAYGQFCLVLPEHDAVLAMTAATEDLQGVLDAFYRHVLPAFRTATSGSPATSASPTGVPALAADAAAADEDLATRLAGLALAPVAGATRPPGEGTGWDGFTAAPATGPLARVSLTRQRGGWRAELVSAHPGDAGAPLEVPVTGDGWTVSASVLPDGAAVPVATSAGWSERGLRLDVVFLQTPHRLTVECHLDGPTATAAWLTTPLGDPPLHSLRAPVGRAGQEPERTPVG